MDIQSLLAEETLRRQEFPVCAHKVFLAHAGVCPLPHRVARAMQSYLEAAAGDDQEDVLPESVVAETRQLAARLLDARSEEIAFVGSTSMGLAMVAGGLPWQPGDNLVCYRDDYPANVYPWMDLASRGVEVRFVQPRVFGNVTVQDLKEVLDGRTRLVALASAHFLTGWRLAVDEMGAFLKERGVWFCLDGIQSLGALRTSMQWVDFAAADAHKWLLGPMGAAILFVRQEHVGRLHPVLVGWRSAPCPHFVAQEKLAFWPDARRYEPGSLNLVSVVGLQAALQIILELGIQPITSRVVELAQQVVTETRRRGYAVIGPTEGPGLSGIVSLTHPIHDLTAVHSQLQAAGIVTSLRRRRDGISCLRISSHFYNTEKEISTLINHLPA